LKLLRLYTILHIIYMQVVYIVPNIRKMSHERDRERDYRDFFPVRSLLFLLPGWKIIVLNNVDTKGWQIALKTKAQASIRLRRNCSFALHLTDRKYIWHRLKVPRTRNMPIATLQKEGVAECIVSNVFQFLLVLQLTAL
jgi:hypothetical protein